ncbi:MAG: TlpA family protein disulfide reductase [Elusimicrobiaceae bacterium]|nr:TlpA family protein disulfide reductase [Elusimicrobiaceae bacterium]
MKKLVLAILCALSTTACLMSLPEITTLPNVQLPLVNEEKSTWNSSDYVGKPVMLVFMGSWCPWCKRTMPAVMQAAEKFGDQVEIVAVFMDNDVKPVQAALKEHQFTVKSVYNGGELAEALSVQGLPHTIVFDKKHRAVQHWEGFSNDRLKDFEAALQKLTK